MSQRETPREVFEALLDEMHGGDEESHCGSLGPLRAMLAEERAEWLERFDAAQGIAFSPKNDRVPALDGIPMGAEFLYCASCPFQLAPGAASRPQCPDCGEVLYIWKREPSDTAYDGA